MKDEKGKRKILSLFVFIDAFGWEFLNQHPFLDDILHTKSPLGTVFGYSATCIPTILTGKLPSEHQHFSFFYYDPHQSPFGLCRTLAFLPQFLTSRGRVRRVISRVLQKMYGITGYFQIYNVPFEYLPYFDYSEKKDIYQPGGIRSGEETIFDYLRQRNIPFYLSDWRLKEKENLATLERSLKRDGARFAYLYLASMDAILHQHGPETNATREKIEWYDTELRKIMALARQEYDDVHLYIFSDHGMTAINQLCDLTAKIDRLGFRFGKDYAAMYDSTMARFWFFKDEARKKITSRLAEEPSGEFLSDERLKEYGCYFPDHQYGELFYLMNPGVLICPSFMGRTGMGGMHGYNPYHKDSLAMFASNQVPDPMPRRLDDLFQLMVKEVA